MFPSVDHGYDLEVEGGVRIQVKSAHLSFNRPYKYGAYMFRLRQSVYGRYDRKPVFSDKNHFVVLWGIEENRFWIVPAHLLDGKGGVGVGPKVSYVSVNIEDARTMIESGSPIEDVAAKYECSVATIKRRLKGLYTKTSRGFCIELRSFEDKWNQIPDFLNTLREADGLPLLATSNPKVEAE